MMQGFMPPQRGGGVYVCLDCGHRFTHSPGAFGAILPLASPKCPHCGGRHTRRDHLVTY